jgi:hypothetical protein
MTSMWKMWLEEEEDLRIIRKENKIKVVWRTTTRWRPLSKKWLMKEEKPQFHSFRTCKLRKTWQHRQWPSRLQIQIQATLRRPRKEYLTQHYQSLTMQTKDCSKRFKHPARPTVDSISSWRTSAAGQSPSSRDEPSPKWKVRQRREPPTRHSFPK